MFGCKQTEPESKRNAYKQSLITTDGSSVYSQAINFYSCVISPNDIPQTGFQIPVVEFTLNE